MDASTLLGVGPVLFSQVAKFASQGALRVLSMTSQHALDQVFGPLVDAWKYIDMVDWPFAPTDFKNTHKRNLHRDALLARLQEWEGMVADGREDEVARLLDPRSFSGGPFGPAHVVDYWPSDHMKQIRSREDIYNCGWEKVLSICRDWAERLRTGKLSPKEEMHLVSGTGCRISDGTVFPPQPPLFQLPSPFVSLSRQWSAATDADLAAAIRRIRPGILQGLMVGRSNVTDAGLSMALQTHAHAPADLLIGPPHTGSAFSIAVALGGLLSLRRLELVALPGGIAAAVLHAPYLQELYSDSATLGDIMAIVGLTHLRKLKLHVWEPLQQREDKVAAFVRVLSACTQLTHIGMERAVSLNPQLLQCIIDHIPGLEFFRGGCYFGEFYVAGVDHIGAFCQHYHNADIRVQRTIPEDQLFH